ncbi:hypothetical protein F4775DRAFT_571010 [Biscogniauxia sp. FL1348]|nr:hypothetical protein F4775DRAFT_571010 [Biscogniauxia sp. FL1348]
MFARCCTRQLWRLPGFLPAKRLYPVRTINSGISAATTQETPIPTSQETPISDSQETPISDSQETPISDSQETPISDSQETPSDVPAGVRRNKHGREIKRTQVWSEKCEFQSKIARFLDLEVIMGDPETSPFIFQYHPKERLLTYQPGKHIAETNTKPRWDFRILYNCEPNRRWKVQVYEKSLRSIRKSIMSTRQVRGHLHSATSRIFSLNNINLINLGPLSAPKNEDDGDPYPVVEFKDLRAWVERDGFNRPILIWISIAHLESEQLAEGQWASKIQNPPPIWTRTLNGISAGNRMSPRSDDLTWILERFSDTIDETVRSGPGRDLFREGGPQAIPRLPIVFSLREHYFWFLWENAPHGPMTGQYAGSWIPRIEGEPLPHEQHTPIGPQKGGKRTWTRQVQKRQTGRQPSF